jgi:hypothetical protein
MLGIFFFISMVIANISVLLWQRGKPSSVQPCLEACYGKEANPAVCNPVWRQKQAKTNNMIAYGVLIHGTGLDVFFQIEPPA